MEYFILSILFLKKYTEKYNSYENPHLTADFQDNGKIFILTVYIPNGIGIIGR